jgi:8-oxo-dGTP pyrophosphatase MutT (NUDIX family)
LVWRDGKKGPKLAIIHRPDHDDWSLPKGKCKPGESFREAAKREVTEEIGCKVRLGSFAGWTLYRVKSGLKLVLFWHMTTTDGCHFEPNDEVDKVEWLDPKEALARLDHPAQRRVVRKALARPLEKAVAMSRGA